MPPLEPFEYHLLSTDCAECVFWVLGPPLNTKLLLSLTSLESRAGATEIPAGSLSWKQAPDTIECLIQEL